MSPIYFVHIPKTAGTSFRKASETFFGLRHVVYDYADDSNETSPFILDIVYGEEQGKKMYDNIFLHSTALYQPAIAVATWSTDRGVGVCRPY